MDQRLLANDYDVIAAKIKTLAQDIQYITRQSDLIGGIDDTSTFRKQLTVKIQSTSKLLMVIKNGIVKANDNGGTDNKWKKLEQQFLNNFERLREVTESVRTEFKTSQPKEAKQAKSTQSYQSNNNNNNNTDNWHETNPFLLNQSHIDDSHLEKPKQDQENVITKIFGKLSNMFNEEKQDESKSTQPSKSQMDSINNNKFETEKKFANDYDAIVAKINTLV
eukprot:359248_1